MNHETEMPTSWAIMQALKKVGTIKINGRNWAVTVNEAGTSALFQWRKTFSSRSIHNVGERFSLDGDGNLLVRQLAQGGEVGGMGGNSKWVKC